MTAVFINCLAVLVGSTLGLLIKKSIPEHFKVVVFSASGLVTLVLGLSMALKTQSYLVMIFALACGGICGYALRIEERIMALGNRFENREHAASPSPEGRKEKNFGLGFLTASVLFCSGAMAVVGSIDAGVRGDYSLILIKSVMDGAMSIVLAAAYGPGVMASVAAIFLYQGFFTVTGRWLEPFLGEQGIGSLSAVGGILLLMIGFNAGNEEVQDW